MITRAEGVVFACPKKLLRRIVHAIRAEVRSGYFAASWRVRGKMRLPLSNIPPSESNGKETEVEKRRPRLGEAPTSHHLAKTAARIDNPCHCMLVS
jgi:hypothetical protein